MARIVLIESLQLCVVGRSVLPSYCNNDKHGLSRRRRASVVGRVRYSLAEARAEATRRAEAFVADRPDRDQWKLCGARPNTLVSPSRASKHPVAWVVMYSPVPPDGGEMFVAVDLELSTVGLRPW
jgi:hypothetical protein